MLRDDRVTSMNAVDRRGDGIRIWQSPGALVEGNYVYDTAMW